MLNKKFKVIYLYCCLICKDYLGTNNIMINEIHLFNNINLTHQEKEQILENINFIKTHLETMLNIFHSKNINNINNLITIFEFLTVFKNSQMFKKSSGIISGTNQEYNKLHLFFHNNRSRFNLEYINKLSEVKQLKEILLNPLKNNIELKEMLDEYINEKKLTVNNLYEKYQGIIDQNTKIASFFLKELITNIKNNNTNIINNPEIQKLLRVIKYFKYQSEFLSKFCARIYYINTEIFQKIPDFRNLSNEEKIYISSTLLDEKLLFRLLDVVEVINQEVVPKDIIKNSSLEKDALEKDKFKLQFNFNEDASQLKSINGDEDQFDPFNFNKDDPFNFNKDAFNPDFLC